MPPNHSQAPKQTSKQASEPTPEPTSELQQLNAQLRAKNEELRQAQAALRASEERYALAVRGSHDGIWDWDVLSGEVYYSARFKEILGYQENEISHRFNEFESRLHPDDRDRVLSAVQNHIENKAPYDIEYRLRTKQSHYRWINARGQAIWDKAGKAIRMAGSITDITVRKQIETQLENSVKELSDVKFALDQSSILAITDEKGRILEVNDKFCEIAGYGRSELIGKTHRIINSGCHPASFFEVMWQTILSGKVWHGEVQNKTKRGEFYWVDTTVVPILNDAEQPMQFVAIRNDITERKRAESALRSLNEELEKKVQARTEALELHSKELERSNAELQQFAYVASHDLQEPLRTISSFTELLAQEYGDRLDGEAEEYIEFIVDGALRMQQLIKDLLAYSRVNSRGKSFATTDCEAVVERVINSLKFAIEENQARVTYDPLPNVFADESQVQQLFQNLVSNALKFRAQAPPHVHISAVKQPETARTDDRSSLTWTFCVSDNGIGIEPNYREQIFEIFQRLHSRRIYAGTGIGLAICRKIVQRHGGRIWVEDSESGGAAFHFTLSGQTVDSG